MNKNQFVKAIKEVVYDAAVADAASVLERPPGRRPDPDLLSLSKWYHSLAAADQALVRKVIELSAHHSVFGFLAVLDGIRAVEDGPGSGIQLTHSSATGAVVLNEASGPYLHDLFNQELGLVDNG